MSDFYQLLRLRQCAIAGISLLGVVLVTEPAAACGGLFCSATNPVNQAAERIIFAADGQTVSAVIEIQYQGPAELFSWVLPVPGVPDIAVSSKLALDRLQARTNPQYVLQTQFAGSCFGPDSAGSGGAGGSNADDVTVLESGTVGPYNFQVIRVAPTLPYRVTVAVEWRDMTGYDVSGFGEERLRPYLDNLNLLAFKLTKDATVGSIRPVFLRYESPNAMIPIRPTAVAANDDMGVMVWVLGRARAVPVNYRSLVLNDTLIDWFNPNRNYNDVVIAAADEAGGHGFVTEYADTADSLGEVVFPESENRASAALNTALPLRVLLEDLVENFAAFDGLRDALSARVPLRTGVDVDQLVECVSCYFEGLPAAGTVTDDPIFATDKAVLLAEVEKFVFEPMRTTQALFGADDWVTRLYTTLSPGEMTNDPVFDFNPDLEAVSNLHFADQVITCDDEDTFDAPWETTLPDGTSIRGAGTTWPLELSSGAPANRLVLQLGTRGEGQVLLDNGEEIQDFVDENNAANGAGAPSGMGGAATAGAGGTSSGGRSDAAGSGAADDAGAPGSGGDPYTPGGGGCGCRTASGSPSTLGVLVAGLLAFAALGRRRGRVRRD